MIRRFRLYFQRLGLFNCLINLLLFSQLVYVNWQIWMFGYWWFSLATITLGAIAGLCSSWMLPTRAKLLGSSLQLCFFYLLGITVLQRMGHIRVPIEWLFINCILCWFYWVATFFFYSYDPSHDIAGLRLAMAGSDEDRKPNPLDPDEENPYRRAADR